MSELPEVKAVKLDLEDEWLTISFNQPEKRNALTEELTNDLKNIIETTKDDLTIRGVTMRGEGAFFVQVAILKCLKPAFKEENKVRVM